MNDFIPQDPPVSIRTILEAGRALEARFDSALAPHGLTTAGYGVLKTLVLAQEPLALYQLAQRLACVRSNVTQLLDRLEADHLVERVPSPKDRRSITAAVTPRGRERYALGAAVEADLERQVLDGLSPQDRQRLGALLGRISTPGEPENARSRESTQPLLTQQTKEIG
jgi:DNA-binding MarR family transcriptional regulator